MVGTRYEMPKIPNNISFMSPSLNRLMKNYATYCKEQMVDLKEIDTLNKWYWDNRMREISKSLTYEKYLRDKRPEEIKE